MSIAEKADITYCPYCKTQVEGKLPAMCRSCLIESYCDEPEDDRGYCDTCQNTGEIDCYCGGDLCVCIRGPYLPCPDCKD